MLTEKQIIKNWNTFIQLVDREDKRWQRLKKFYELYEDRFSLMPASSKVDYHSAHIGGYIDHVIRVHDLAFKVKDLWQSSGAEINFSDDELSMVAINHDLGKFGSQEFEMYVDQTSDWHRERGEIFKNNPELSFMKIQDRSLFLLQEIGVKLTENEYLAIKLHDGLYEESNKSYFISFSKEYKLRSHLTHIIHQADYMASKIEQDIFKEKKTPLPNSVKKILKD